MKNKILHYNAQVPRYTSYPTAPHFHDVEEESYLASLKTVEGNISLYIHIPFCQQMCFYCGCHTTATRKYAPIESYLPLLLREISTIAEKLPQRMTVTHIHFGGGSPNMLQPADFLSLMSAIRKHFDIALHAEIALEADPRSINEEKARAYKEGGVTRASLGIQDFSPKVQEAIGRIQSFSIVEKATNLLRIFDIPKINFDLMYGLPCQEISDIEDTVEKSLSLGPDRIAVFGYAHVPWMKKHMRLIREEDLPDSAARINQFSKAKDLLTNAGMISIGLDHFVKANDSMLDSFRNKTLRRNFQGYTTDTADALIGFGTSSISQLPNGFFQNVLHVAEYEAAITQQKLPVGRGRLINSDDRLRAEIISDLMCYFEVDVPEKINKYDEKPDYFDPILKNLDDLAQDGLITHDDGVIHIQPEAHQIARIVAARFDAYLNPDHKKHVQVA